MKLILIFILILITCCASSMVSLRKFPDRTYRPCQNFETEKPVGKFCYRYCVKYRFMRSDVSENCIKWETDVRDLSTDGDFEAFRAGGFILVNEKNVY